MALRNQCIGCLSTLLVIIGYGLGYAADPAPVQFNRDVRPILSDMCFQCHGPDAAQRQAGLRLDTEQGLVSETDSGVRPVVAGDEVASELIRRITSTDPDVVMPPPDSGKRLSADQIDLLRRWVREGGKWQGHWAFIPPVRPSLPEVEHPERVVNAIDRFVMARAAREGLSFSPEADKVTLLRRVRWT